MGTTANINVCKKCKAYELNGCLLFINPHYDTVPYKGGPTCMCMLHSMEYSEGKSESFKKAYLILTDGFKNIPSNCLYKLENLILDQKE